MTISVNGKVGAPEGLELEAISTERGVETSRSRHANGTDVSLTVYGSKTIILREVAAVEAIEHKPGEQRHGTLDAPNVNKPALEEGDLDTVGDELMEEVMDAVERVFDVARALVAADSDKDAQATVYDDLRQAVQGYEAARAAADAYQDGQERTA